MRFLQDTCGALGCLVGVEGYAGFRLVGFQVSGLGFRVLGFRFPFVGLGFRVQDQTFKVLNLMNLKGLGCCQREAWPDGRSCCFCLGGSSEDHMIALARSPQAQNPTNPTNKNPKPYAVNKP